MPLSPRPESDRPADPSATQEAGAAAGSDLGLGSPAMPTTGAFFYVEITGNPVGKFASCTGLSVEVRSEERRVGKECRL